MHQVCGLDAVGTLAAYVRGSDPAQLVVDLSDQFLGRHGRNRRHGVSIIPCGLDEGQPMGWLLLLRSGWCRRRGSNPHDL